MNPDPQRTSIDWMWVKELRDEVSKLYNSILIGDITPNELKKALEAKINDFSGKKLKRIIREVNYHNTNNIFISLFNSINYFNIASDDRKEEKLKEITQKTLRLVDQFDKVLEENVEIEQYLQTHEREKPTDVEATGSKTNMIYNIDNENIESNTKSNLSDMRVVNSSPTHQSSVLSQKDIQRDALPRRNLSISLDGLIKDLGALEQFSDQWRILIKRTESNDDAFFRLTLTSQLIVFAIRRYKKDWLDLETDLQSHYSQIWERMKEKNQQLITNLNNLQECIEELKEPKNNIKIIMVEVTSAVETISEIVRHGILRTAGSN